MACEKCWQDATRMTFHTGQSMVDMYRKLLDEREINPCTPEEQAYGNGWKSMDTAPRDGTEIIGMYPQDGGEVEIRYSEIRVCMLADFGGAAGTFAEGWEDCLNGLVADIPDAWRTA